MLDSLQAVSRLQRKVADRLFYAGIKRIRSGPAAGLLFDSRGMAGYIRGDNEMPVQQVFVDYLLPDHVFYDVGANIGFFTVLGARMVGPGGRVYAFEPVRSNAQAIRSSIAMNRLDNVLVVEKAVSWESGIEALRLTADQGGAALASGDVTPPDVVASIGVETVCIDDLVFERGFAPPTFIKIDVEGAEMGVLSGMTRTLRIFGPILVYEMDDGDPHRLLTRQRKVEAFTARLDYKTMRLPDSYTNPGWAVGHWMALPHYL